MPKKQEVIEEQNIIEESKLIKLSIKSKITKLEKEAFVRSVLMDVSLSDPMLTFFELEESFLTNFVSMFTDLDTISHDMDEVAVYSAVKEHLYTFSLVQDLKNCIEKQLIYKNASTNAIESFNLLLSKGLDAADKAMLTLDKAQKLLTKKNLEKMLQSDKSNELKGIITQFINKNVEEK